MDFKEIIRSIPDFPQKGILFRDITTVLHDPDAIQAAIGEVISLIGDTQFDFVVGPESRGFIFGMPVAVNMKKGFIPIRKAGKLPAEVYKKTYDLEYGTATIEMHKDALKPGQRVVIIDDLLATGGTCKAICELIEETGAEIAAMIFFIELEGLNGRELFEGYNVHSVVKY